MPRASTIPEAFKSTLAEISRLYDAGELTSEAYEPLCAKARAATKGHPYSADLVERIALYDPGTIEIDMTNLVEMK